MAADALGVALVLDRLGDVAEILNEHGRDLGDRSVVLRSIINRITTGSDDDPTGIARSVDDLSRSATAHLAALRRSLRNGPRNPLGWADLGLLYAYTGSLRKAERALLSAVQLAPTSRYILRVIARFYVHIGEPDKGIHFLRRSSLLRVDPWIMAADVAVSDVADVPHSNVVHRLRLLDADVDPFHLSELASALATRETDAGSIKRARKLLDLSLINPTENSIAQAVWLRENDRLTSKSLTLLDAPGTFEAQALDKYYHDDWDGCLTNSVKWLLDEPYSSRSAVLSAHIAGVVYDDIELATRIGEVARAANPGDNTVINNLAFYYASQDNILGAERILDQYQIRDNRDRIVHFATRGLIEFRKGRSDAGRRLYRQSIALADDNDQKSEKAAALVYLLREELRAGSDYVAAVTREIDEVWDHHKDDSLRATRVLRDRLVDLARGGSAPAPKSPLPSSRPDP